MQPEPRPERLAARREPPPRPLFAAPPRLAHAADERPTHDARALTAGGNEAEIRLDGVRYVLRITRQGKLILTK
jgi:hemin uptake protein HemP